MAQLDILQFSCLADNYGVLVHDMGSGVTASIDAPDARAVQAALNHAGWKLDLILTTHHHADHTGGNLALVEATGCSIIGPAAEAARVPGIGRKVGEGDVVDVGEHKVRVLSTPGHTAGHISYWFEEAGVAFVGDTLFSLGCGRVLEGDHQMMWKSLEKIAALPPETAIYCGHEYTVSNGRFALTIEPENEALKARVAEAEKLRAKSEATVPTTIKAELAANPFVRPQAKAIRERLGMLNEPDWKVFGEIRSRKDRF